MKYIYILLLTALAFTSCHKMDIGYLETWAAKYQEDQMTVRKTPDPYEDWAQVEYGSDWVSDPLEGVQGTNPRKITISSVVSPDGGNVETFLKEVTLRGDGTFTVPVENNIPLGTYVVSLSVSNEDHSHILKDIFTIIVVEQ